MKKILIQAIGIFIASCLFPNLAHAQHDFHNCGADEYHEHLMNTDPEYHQNHEEDQAAILKYMRQKYAEAPLTIPTGASKRVHSNFKTAPKYVIPVVVHLIHDGTVNNLTDAQVTNGINELNKYFRGDYAGADPLIADTEIEFCLASQDPDGNYTTGITRTNSTLTSNHVDFQDPITHQDIRNLIKWPQADYLNIWVVRTIKNAGGFSPLGNQGGFFVTGGGLASGGKVMPHEAGHTLGLSHTFNNGCINWDCLSDGDYVCDTPPDDLKNGPCINNSCDTDDDDITINNPYRPIIGGGLGDQNDHTNNIMDYGAGCGPKGFTTGQKDRMHWFLDNRLNSWTTSLGCVPPCPAPITINVTPSDTVINSGGSFTITNSSINAISHSWYVDTTLVSTSANPTISIVEGGFHTITYIAGNPGNISCTVDTSFTVEVLCPGLTVDFTMSTDTAVSGSTTSFTNTTTGGHLQYWYYNGVLFDSTTNASLTLYTQGDYEIKLEVTDTNTNCTYSKTQWLHVHCPVLTSFTMSKDVITSPETITLTNTSSGASTFEWRIDNVFSSNSFHHSTFHGTLGNQIVTLIADNGNCRDSTSSIISYMDPDACTQFAVNKWYFGGQAGIDFNNFPATPLTDGVMWASNGSSSISNQYGNLLFYSNGESVWDASHAIMPSGSGLSGSQQATQAALIIPVPGSDTRFYLFYLSHCYYDASSGVTAPGTLYYSEIDITLNGGLGDIVPGTKNTVLMTGMTEKLAATRHSDGCSFWVTAHEFGNNNFQSWMVDYDGLNTTPVTSSIGRSHGDDPNSGEGQMKFSPNGSRIGLITSNPNSAQPPPITPNGTFVEVFDFDNSSGLVTSILLTDTSDLKSGYGCEFSPDNDKFYITHISPTMAGFENVEQYQVNLGTPAANLASRTLLNSFVLFDCWACTGNGLQLGPDNLIYHAEQWLPQLHVITSPNSIGTAAGHTEKAFNLGGGMSLSSLPNVISGMAGSVDFTYDCTEDGVEFSFTTDMSNVSTILWEFGDGSTSTDFSPTHLYATNDTFDVKLKIFNICQCATITKEVVCPTCTGGVGAPFANINVTPSGPVCAGTALTFTATDTSGGGTTPTFDWLVNGVSTGTNSMTYGPVSLNDGDNVSFVFTSSLCTMQSDTFSTVVDIFPDEVPDVSIRASADTICANESVDFVVRDSIGGGTDPTFQWYLNGTPVGTDANSYTVSSIQVGDSVSIRMTPNTLCPAPATDTDGLAIVILPNDNPNVQIAPDVDSVCTGTMITFSVTDSTGGGTDPVFDWYINGFPYAGDVNTVSDPGFIDGDSISIVMTSNATCSSVLSDTASYVITIQSNATPNVTLTASATSICTGQSVTFSVTDSTNGGADPTFSWYVNGILAAGDQNTYTDPGLIDQDSVAVIMTSNSSCASPTTDTGSVVITVGPALVPQVQLTASDDTICPGQSVTFTVTDSTNSGTDPTFSWYINGVLAAGDQNTYTDPGLIDQDSVAVIMTSNSSCASPGTDTASATITVLTSVAPNVSVSVDQNPICDGDLANFTVTDSTGAGTDPTFQWFINGVLVAGDQNTFSSSSLSDNDSVSVIITSNEACPSPITDTANITMTVDSCAFSTNFTVDQTSICVNDTVYFTATANGLVTGDSLLWDFGSGSVPLSGDTGTGPLGVVYTTSGLKDLVLYRTGANPDTITKLSYVTVHDYPTAAIDTIPDSLGYCQGMSFTLNAQSIAGASYQWYYNGSPLAGETSQSITISNPGEYEVEVSQNGCSSISDSIIAHEHTTVTPSVSMVADQDSICSGTMINYTVIDSTNGGTNPTFTWLQTGVASGTGNTYSSNTLDNGDSVLVVMLSNNICQTDSLSISNVHSPYVYPATGSLSLITGNLTPCVNGPNESFATNLLTGTYNWVVTSGSAIINSFTNNTATIAPGDTNSTVRVEVFGTCDTAILDLTINPVQLPDPAFSIGKSTLCSGESTLLSVDNTATGINYEIYRDGNLLSASSSAMISDAGTYHVIASDGGCDSTSTTVVVSEENIDISASADPDLIYQGEYSLLTVNGTIPFGSTVAWTPAGSLDDASSFGPIASPDTNTTYYVTVTSPAGCVDNDQISIQVILPIIIPNVFTPNGDGDHDNWEISGLYSYPGATLEIYNRWGSLVYKSSGSIMPWDGYRDNQPMPVATYYFILDLGISDDESDKYTGSVTLVR